MIPEKDWLWFGNAGHFIGGRDCRFHLCTLVGDHLVSTVGQYDPDFGRQSLKGYVEIGYKRKYETMVFATTGKVCHAKGCGCEMPEIVPTELDFSGYNSAGAASKGHVRLCRKWGRK